MQPNLILETIYPYNKWMFYPTIFDDFNFIIKKIGGKLFKKIVLVYELDPFIIDKLIRSIILKKKNRVENKMNLNYEL